MTPVRRALGLTWIAFVLATTLPALARSAAGAAASLAGLPWHPALPVALANTREVVLLTAAGLALAAAGWCAGFPLLRWIARRRAPGRIGRAAAWPFGLGAIATAGLGLLLVRLYTASALWAAAAALAAAGARAGRREARSLKRLRPRAGAARAAVVVALLGVPWWLAPEGHGDGWWHFLAAPRRWLALHGFSAAHAPAPFHFPALTEVPAGLGLALGVDRLGTWITAGGFLCGAAALVNAGAGRSPGWAWLSLLAGGGSAFLLSTGKGDAFATGATLLALAALLPGGGLRGGPRAAVSGACAGLAVCAKLTAAAHAAWLLPVLMAGSPRPARAARRWSTAALATSGAWFLKEWLATGDPAFPLLAGVVPRLVDGWDARNAAVTRLALATTPLSPAAVHGAAASLLELAPLAGALLPLFLLEPRPDGRGRPHRRAVGLALIVLGAWHAVGSQPNLPRHAFAAVAAVAVLTAGGGPAAWTRDRRLRAALLAVAVPGVALRVVTPFANGNPLPFCAGAERRGAFLARTFTTLAELQSRLLARPSAGRTLMVGDPHVDAVPDGRGLASNEETGGSTPLLWRLADSTPREADLRRRFRQLGIARLVYNPRRGYDTANLYTPFVWTPRQVALWRGFVGRWLDLEGESPRTDGRFGGYAVYRLRSRPREGAPALLPHLPGLEVPLMNVRRRFEAGDVTGGVALVEAHRRLVGPVGDLSAILGLVYRQLGRNEDAAREYGAAYGAGLRTPELVTGYGLTLYRLGRFAEAVPVLETARRLYPVESLPLAALLDRARRGR